MRHWKAFVVAPIAIAFVVALSTITAVLRVDAELETEPIWAQVNRLLSDELVAGERHGRINILLVGINKQGQTEPPLTDTLVLLSIFPTLNAAALLSIPGDLSVEFPGGTRRKLNEVYRRGEEIGTGGREESRRIVSETIGVPIHYAAVIDFGDLQRVIDEVGGIWIEVRRYVPDPPNTHRCRPIRPPPRWMDGDTAVALILADSSRFPGASDDRVESDFARSRRQQGVLLALRDRLRLRLQLFWLNPWATPSFVADLLRSVDTDLEPWEIAALGRIVSPMYLEHVPALAVADVVETVYDADGTFRELQARGGLEPLRSRVRNLLSRPALIDVQRLRPSACAKSGGVLVPAPEQPRIVPRDAWDLKPDVIIAPHQHVHGIVIHHDDFRHDAHTGEAKVRELREFLPSDALDIPFHYLIDIDGKIIEGAPEWTVVHTRTPHDPANLLHIALLGEYSREKPTAVQLRSLVELVEWKAAEHGLTPAQISLHSDLTETDCPGSFVYDWLATAPWCEPPAPTS